jgi:glutamate synthase domain-containing protein 2/glutamate synthase domain-containing protein 1/glutamate synthase domain-containing protein 3
MNNNFPLNQGLYNNSLEKDSCGVGFICDIEGRPSNSILRKSLTILERLAHRGAVGADPKTGDGAGILIQMPHELLIKKTKNLNFKLPEKGEYASGIIFFPKKKADRDKCKKIIDNISAKNSFKILGYRTIPLNNSVIGKSAKASEPAIEQVFITPKKKIKDELDFERALYILRKEIENKISSIELNKKSDFYICSLSARTIIYKGLLTPHQVAKFFLDLKDKDLKTSLALVHSRYSTNTFPSWSLAQPFRMLAHNGEINTLKGNVNWMKAREGSIYSENLKSKLKKTFPVVTPQGSDSASIDNAFELLNLSGRSLAHAIAMLIPPAWQQNRLLDKKVKDFYMYHSALMEPWDGPAAIAFTDGKKVGALLDRNGLRPARYIVTKDNLVIMASEVGVLDTKGRDIKLSGRLEPGKILLIDTEKKEIIDDDIIKKNLAKAQPYGKWLKENTYRLSSYRKKSKKSTKAKPFKIKDTAELKKLMRAFGYSREDLSKIILPMAEEAKEPIGSMGNDTPHAVLSKRPQLIYNYFKQLFAQVTNPAIDPIREEIVTSLGCFIGPEDNLLSESGQHVKRLYLEEPILKNAQLNEIKKFDYKKLKSRTLSLRFDINKSANMLKRINELCRQAESAVKNGAGFIILSDRDINNKKAAVSALLALGAVHHHLIKKLLRTKTALIIETAEAREVHHFAMLFAHGADAVNPYLAFEAVRHLTKTKELNLKKEKAINNYIEAVNKGLLKILSKMGISTLQSYKGAQICEALGLSNEVINKCFLDTISRIEGASFNTLAKEILMRHQQAYADNLEDNMPLSTGGIYQWKKDGEFHLWNPNSIALLQDAARKNDYAVYKEFTEAINNQKDNPTTIRSLFDFKKKKPIPISKVEPVSKILKRFVTGAMSFGSISKEAHEYIAIALNRIGGKSNTGEGGEDPMRFTPLKNGDLKRSAIKQVASGRFGVNTNYLINADEIQIKIAQGAKPGEGGQLPGHKVSEIIAKTRYTTPGVTLISPPPHHDIYSIEDLAQLIFDLKNVNPQARISVKLVSEIGVGTIAAGVAKGHADMILISGADGGTGASPMSSIRHAGLPWELGLSETHQTLVLNGLRNRLRLQTDGQMRTGRDVAIAAMLGAEEYGFCTAALIIMGCVMLRHCHLNNCALGVATQDEVLRKRFSGRPEYLVNYFNFIAQDLREIMAELGIRKLDDLIGRTDLLKVNKNISFWKAKGLDLSRILFRPRTISQKDTRCTKKQNHGISSILDKKLIRLARPALKEQKVVREELSINNTNRTTGSMLSGRVCSLFGESGLIDESVNFKFRGVAGQSFAAWLAKGITFELEGLANDYVGKGLSGGKLVIYPDRESDYKPDKNIIIGNTAFYGAISGEAYISGAAGERFCVRNSGLISVVEAVGDHGCEYMTGGLTLIIGETGRNFAAGMSGGIAYVLDENNNFKKKCNLKMVELEKLKPIDKETIHNMLHNHYKYTKSKKAKAIIDNFNSYLNKFVKVMPLEYKRILDTYKLDKELDLKETK